MAVVVTTSAAGTVRPSSPTPTGTLPLAYFDRHPAFRRTLADCLHVYVDGPADGTNPAAVIRSALARALVFYYPMAGRIVELDSSGDIAVECTGDGVFFIEAAADCSLEDLGFLLQPLAVPWDALRPAFPGDERWTVEPHNTLMMMQVTKFRCGGFAVAIRVHHAVADGIGAAQILGAVGDMARGLAEPKILPVWGRDTFPNPSIKYEPMATVDVPLDLEYIELDLPTSYINRVKSQYAAERGKICSSFDVIAAKVWQCQVRALAEELPPEAAVTFRAIMSVRHQLKLGDGYYGNATLPSMASAPSEKVRRSSILDVIALVKKAKDGVSAELSRFAGGEMGDPLRVAGGYGTLTVVDWCRIGFSEVDFGFGPPKFWTGPVPRCPFPSAFILNPPAPADGKMLMAVCVGKEHREEFLRGWKNCSS